MGIRFATDAVRRVFRSFGFDIVRYVAPSGSTEEFPPDIDDATKQLFLSVRPYTMTGIERIGALRESVQYVCRHEIPGEIVECGVWKGGSMMAVAKTLMECGSASRSLFLFDTFEGMPLPGEYDKDVSGNDASSLLDRTRDRKNSDVVWAVGPAEVVRGAMRETAYPEDKLVFVKGKVEETVPAQAPAHIALLRLDTDWYESTYHELVHLYPRLSVGGVLIIDDYGHWHGARRAVDQYIAERGLKLLLNRIDYTARICVKTEP
jgi:hypothetical protein